MKPKTTKGKLLLKLPEASAGSSQQGVHEKTGAHTFNLWIDKHAVLAEFPMCERSLYNYREQGLIPHVLWGKKILYNRTALELMLLQRQKGGKGSE